MFRFALFILLPPVHRSITENPTSPFEMVTITSDASNIPRDTALTERHSRGLAISRPIAKAGICIPLTTDFTSRDSCLLSRIRDNKHYHDIPVITTFSICGVIVEMKPQKTRDNSQHFSPYNFFKSSSLST
ncbi:MAG: hypothetical protein IJI36_06395, partial [Kiritimatiellae bacterium]|nr:hypothetical protein [Kiritimatiellia bacterium]